MHSRQVYNHERGRNVESKSNHVEEHPLDQLNHVASNRCIRILEDQAVLKNKANKCRIEGFERSLEAKILGYTANEDE